MALKCAHCGCRLLWWDLKPSFPCPACDSRLQADIARAWTVTFLIWLALIAPVIVIAVRDADGGVAFALALAGPICVLGLGYAIGSLVFRQLAVIRRSGH